MKQKQRKITTAQVRALEQKLITLENKRAAIAAQTTPLKVTLRKYIQQNMEEIQHYLTTNKIQYRITSTGASGALAWAVTKISCGYFGDANLKNLIKIAQELKESGLLESNQ